MDQTSQSCNRLCSRNPPESPLAVASQESHSWTRADCNPLLFFGCSVIVSPFKMRLTDVGFVLLLVLPFLVALDDSTIWDANEAFYVETPREMMERGEWIVPYFNGEPRLNKPPLSYWIVTVFYKAMGVSVLAERIATALVAITAVA